MVLAVFQLSPVASRSRMHEQLKRRTTGAGGAFAELFGVSKSRRSVLDLDDAQRQTLDRLRAEPLAA